MTKSSCHSFAPSFSWEWPSSSSSEAIGTLFTFGELAKGERSRDLAEKRLAEVSALVAKGEPTVAERTVVRYEEQLQRSLARAGEVNAEGGDEDRLSARDRP